MRNSLTLIVYALRKSAATGRLRAGHVMLPCAMGRNGAGWRKREGDVKTPIGCWSISQILWRADMPARWSVVPPYAQGRALKQNDGWCDAVGDRNYNRHVSLPYPRSAERLWRTDRRYDLIFVLSHNRCPRVQGLGSAVFLHVAETDQSDAARLLPTAGCVALGKRDFARIRHMLRVGTRLRILC